MKVAICTPTRSKPHPAYLAALEASVPVLDAAGIEHATVFEIGCPYISGARCTMLGKALRWGADAVVFLDDDVSWRPEDLLSIITAKGDVVAGTYRFKCDDGEFYMGTPYIGDTKRPLVRDDGAVMMSQIPAGFMRISREGVERFMAEFPELIVNADGNENVDLFNHGAWHGVWFGEDYAFSRRWNEIGEFIWCIPTLRIDHHAADKAYHGNFDSYLRER